MLKSLEQKLFFKFLDLLPCNFKVEKNEKRSTNVLNNHAMNKSLKYSTSQSSKNDNVSRQCSHLISFAAGL